MADNSCVRFHGNLPASPPPAPSPPEIPPQPSSLTSPVSPTLSAFMKGVVGDNGLSNKCMDSVLHQAAYNGDLDTLKRILGKKEGKKAINDSNHLGCTPLRLAVAAGKMDCVEVLLSSGANVHLADIKAQTPVMVAVKNHNLDCLRALLKAGANPDGHVHSLYTPLFWAAQEGNHAAVKELLMYGANTENNRIVNHLTIPSSPARIALVYRKYACFKELLSVGAELMQDSNRQVSLYHLAVTRRVGEEYIRLMYEHGVPYYDRDDLQSTVVRKSMEQSESWRTIQELFSVPRSLVSLCRVKIRCIMISNNKLAAIDQLPLPRKIIQYLTFS